MNDDIVFTLPDEGAVSQVEGGKLLFRRSEKAVRLLEDEMGRRGLGYTPGPEEWSTWNTRMGGSGQHVAVVVMFGCPKCRGINFLPHAPNSAKALSKLFGVPVRAVATINPKGTVMSHVTCAHRCSFERKPGLIRLDDWAHVKRLYSAQIRRKGRLELETVYTHAHDQREALAHLALQSGEVLEAGPAPAIGWLGDEASGKVFGG